MPAIALPLAPLAPGAAAAAGTFLVGSAAYLAQQVHGFRAPLPAPMIPRTGGKAGGATMQEMVADAIAGARIPVALPPNPLGPNGSLGLAGLMAAAGFLGPRLAQLWGWFASRPATKQGTPHPGNLVFSGKIPAPGNTTPATFEWYASAGQVRPAIAGSCAPGSATNQSSELKAGTVSNVVEAQVYVEMGSCGPYRYGFRVRNNLNQWSLSVLTSSVTQGNAVDTRSFRAAWTGTNSADLGAPVVDLPLPDGYVPPGPKVEPLPAIPVLPKPAPATPEPAPQPTPSPDTEPEKSPVPVEPGPARPPIVVPVTRPGQPGPVAPPKPGSVIVIRPDGTLPVPAPQPPPVTNPDHHFPIPGGGPITGNGPQAKPEEIAKELGRLEQKLNAVLNPTPDTPLEWQKIIQDLWELFTSLGAGTTYTLTEKCPPCDGQDQQVTTIEVPVPGAFGSLGVIQNKIDGIAKLLDAQLGLKQPTCDPCPQAYVGRNISVQFRSTEISPYGDKRLRKALRYRDQSNAPLESHRDHWRDFKWESGSWMVISTGLPWGRPRVWAKSVDEGKRVLHHAAAAAGVNLNDKRHKWVTREVQGVRENPILTMEVHRDNRGLLWVADRDGPAGLPLVSADLSPDINVDH